MLKRIVTQADGVPLFIEELTKAVLEASVDPGAAAGPLAVPATLQASLMARLATLDKVAAEQLPGVYAVLTGEDWTADGLGTLDPEFMAEDMGGPKGFRTKLPPLAEDRVRYVGERVAVVIAATEALARDAAELVSVDYEVLPAVVSAGMRCAPARRWSMRARPSNTSFTMHMGNVDMVEPAFARAHHVTRLSLNNNRVTAVTMEPRGCIADYDPGTRRYTLYTSTQNVHGVRQTLAHQILHVPESRIRVVARDVGGGFGMKGQTYPEEAVLVWASRRVGRPVKWIASRTEALLGDNQARDQTVDAELALDADWQVSGIALERNAQCRRLYRGLWRHPDRVLADAGLDRLRHSGGRSDEQPRLHQHRADRRLIAAPAAPRPSTSWSASSIRRRARCTSTPPNCAGII